MCCALIKMRPKQLSNISNIYAIVCQDELRRAETLVLMAVELQHISYICLPSVIQSMCKIKPLWVGKKECYGIILTFRCIMRRDQRSGTTFLYLTKQWLGVNIVCFCFFLARQPVGQCLLIPEISRSHTTTHHSR